MKKLKMLVRALILFFALLLGAGAGVNFAQAWIDEGIGWDVVYDENDNNDGILSDERITNGYLSLATKSDGYPGIAFNRLISESGDKTSLLYIECSSGSDCASGGGLGYTNWNYQTPTTIEDPGINNYIFGGYVSLDYGSDNKPVTQYLATPDGTSRIRMAKYVGSGLGSGCINGSSDWKCFNVSDSDATSSTPHSDFVIDDSGNYHIVHGTSDEDLAYSSCNISSGCDEVSDFNVKFLEIKDSITLRGARIDADSSGNLHIIFSKGFEINYTTCNYNSTDCNEISDWSTPLEIYNGLTSPVYPGDIEAKAGILAFVYKRGNNLYYAEYVGSGGTGCLSSAWSCLQVSNELIRINSNEQNIPALEMDINSSGERGIAYSRLAVTPVTENIAGYSYCTDNCINSSNWTNEKVAVHYSPLENIVGMLASIEFGSGPRIAFSNKFDSYYRDLFYAEQEGDLPPEEPQIPELPQGSLWKIVIAVLAFGLVIGMVAWRNKKRK